MNREKHVDESWKESASKEKEKEAPEGQGQEAQEGQEHQPIEINFLNYITSLGFQALIFMGEIPNPMTNETEKNLMQSKFIIDTLVMLKDKTKGNLNEQENNFLEATLYELQLKFVEIVKNEQAQGGGQIE